MPDMVNDIAVITGASSGVGRAIALALAARGAKLCLLGRNPETLAAVARDAADLGARVSCYTVDLAEPDAVVETCAAITRDLGRVTILVHSAGVISFGRMDTAPIDELDQHYSVNVRAPYLLTRQLLPVLQTRSAQIVFINSSAGQNARSGVGQYAASKHALKAVADSLREEVNPCGIRVISVYLGRTATPMQERVHAQEGRPYRPDLLMQPDDVAAMVVAALSLPRTAEVTDIHMRPLVKSY